MLQGAGAGMVLRVVVNGGVRQQPVLSVEQGGPGLVQDVRPAALREDEPGAGQDAEDDHDGGREQPLEQVEPVAHQAQGLAAFDLPGEGRVIRKAEMSRKMSTPPETRPSHTW